MRVIAPAYSEIEALLATKAAGKVLSEASTAAIAKARVAIATAVFQMSPAARKFLRDQVKKFADASVLSTLGAEGAEITIQSSGAWKLFVEMLLEIV
ncbi:MAG: hypothetical protein IPF73_10410 [Betaproteobacteria bacterium]|nr:hypothetical protein [Betaproteobacteria bacterium]